MGDIKLSSEFNWGPVKTGMEQMRAFVGQTTAGIQRQITNMFTPTGVGGLLSIGFFEQGITKLVDYGARVFDLGKRFAVSTTDVQIFGNALEKNGSTAERGAAALNRLELAQSKALGGNNDMLQSFANLNITLEDLQTLSPVELLTKIGASSMNAADMVKILGKNGTELRETLRQMADGTINLTKAIDPEHIAALKKAQNAWIEFKETALVKAGGALADLYEGWKKFAALDPGKVNVGPGPVVSKAALDALDQRNISMTEYVRQVQELQKIESGKYSTLNRSPIGPSPSGGPLGGPAAGSAITGAEDVGEAASRAGGAGAANLEDRIAKLREEHAQQSLSDQEKLNQLNAEAHELYYAQGTDQKAILAYLEKQKEIDTLTAKIDKDQADAQKKIDDAREKAAQQAEAELDKETRANRLAQLKLQYGDQIGQAMENQLEVSDELADVQKRIDGAYANDDKKTAAILENLKAQLLVEQGIRTEETQRVVQLAAEEKARKAIEDQRKADEVNRQIDASRINVLRMQGASDEADALELQIRYEDEIQKAVDAEIEARAKNDELTAQTNEKLVEQLQLEEQIAQTQQSAQKMQQLATGLSGYAGNILSSSGYKELAAKYGGRVAFATLNPADPANIMGTDPYTGKVDPAKVAYYVGYFDQLTQGGTKSLGFYQAAGVDAQARLIAQIQGQKANAAALQANLIASQQRATEDYNLMHGIYGAVMPLMPTQPAAPVSFDQAIAMFGSYFPQYASLLTSIDKKVTLPPGTPLL
jgi:hypothetical protein